MMIPQTLTGALTPERSKHSRRLRSYRRAASLSLCVMGLLGSALGCTGEIDADTQAPLSGPVTNPGKGGTAAPGTGAAPRQTPAGSATDDELGNDNVQGVDDEATSPRRRGGAARARAARDDDERDAGDVELVDAGEVDAADVDAAGLDAGAVDAGPAEDASTAAP